MTDTTELIEQLHGMAALLGQTFVVDPEKLARFERYQQSLRAPEPDLRKQNQELQNALSCMTASRDRWRAQAKGKITQEWLRRVADGDVGEVE